jgi:hypothetical protein
MVYRDHMGIKKDAYFFPKILEVSRYWIAGCGDISGTINPSALEIARC